MGQKPSGKQLKPWIRQLEAWGAGEIWLTTMLDGARTGYDLEAAHRGTASSCRSLLPAAQANLRTLQTP